MDLNLSDTFRKSDNRKLCYFIYEESSEMASVSDTHTRWWLLLTYSWRSAKRGAGARLEVRGRTSYRRTRRSHHHRRHKTRCHSPTFSFRPETCWVTGAWFTRCHRPLFSPFASSGCLVFFVFVGRLSGRPVDLACCRLTSLCVHVFVCLYTQLDNTTRSKPNSGAQHCLGVNKCNKFSSFSAI